MLTRTSANLTHFRRTKSAPTAYFHVSPPIPIFLSRVVTHTRRYSLSLSLPRAFHFIITVCPLPVISPSTASLVIRSNFYSFSLSVHLFFFHYHTYLYMCIYIRLPPHHPAPLCVPIFLSLNFLSVTSLPTRRVWSTRKQCRGRSRASALFSLNKFNLNFPAVRNVY